MAQTEKNVIERLCELALAQYASLLDAKKILFDIHNDRAYRQRQGGI